jgi:hypothetical protein
MAATPTALGLISSLIFSLGLSDDLGEIILRGGGKSVPFFLFP